MQLFKKDTKNRQARDMEERQECSLEVNGQVVLEFLLFSC